MSKNASDLYDKIKSDPEKSKALFRQALQDPQGAIQAICEIGEKLGIPVTKDEIKEYLASLDDSTTKQWIMKARGGL